MRGKKIKIREMRSRLIFGACTIISGAAAMFGVNVLPVLLKRMLLDIPSLRLRYGAMRYQKLHGNLLKQLLIFDDGYEWERCSTKEEALTMLEDFLNAIDY